MHIARAYGVPTTRTVKPVSPVSRANAPAGVGALAFPARPQPESFPLRRLIAGSVSRSVEFNGAASEAVPQHEGEAPMQMYTRAADKVEAAVGVQMGRALDVKG